MSEREVTVRRTELLEVLKKNRDKHVADYNEACNGYRHEALKKIDNIFTDLRGKINALKEGTVASVQVFFDLDIPISYEKEYNRAIRMMEMSVDENITLTDSQFKQQVMDDWSWKDAWVGSNSKYIGK